MKTRRAVASRFKRTGGKKLKLKRTHAAKRKHMTRKRPNRKRRIRKNTLVDSTQVRTMAKMMGAKLNK
ncbi:MAG TPA: bL35 family ribosomal protein [Chlamydiales bacterium]|jgi:large subunit ribosomal protein L35|nr:bL35 family ribosomal protein [Chlamydiales bacterium]